MENKVVLFHEKKECCGCGTCVNICPKDAISIRTDSYGFSFPQIDEEKCIHCGACKRVCGYQNMPETYLPIEVYAVAAKEKELLRKSASGGAFAILAKYYLENAGIVYGSSMELQNDKLYPQHIRVTTVDELLKLQGSKYVQSDMGNIYQSIKEDLLQGNKVLFSGTPCQVAGVKRFLGREYDSLLTVEIICHGVPGKKMFQDFMEHNEKKLGGTIKEFYFRDKSKGQGYITRTKYIDRNGKEREKIEMGELMAYIHFFSQSLILRESCYACPFTQKSRVADITIGDFWGFHEEYPKVKESDGLTNSKGISCVLVNNEKGRKLISDNKAAFFCLESDLEKVAKHNAQLNAPSKYPAARDTVMEIYKTGGYEGVNQYFEKHYVIERLKHGVTGMLPKGLKRNVKKLVGLLR